MAVCISIELYENDVVSVQELDKGYTRPIDDNLPCVFAESIRVGHDQLIAVRKIN